MTHLMFNLTDWILAISFKFVYPRSHSMRSCYTIPTFLMRENVFIMLWERHHSIDMRKICAIQDNSLISWEYDILMLFDAFLHSSVVWVKWSIAETQWESWYKKCNGRRETQQPYTIRPHLSLLNQNFLWISFTRYLSLHSHVSQNIRKE